jgi:hypothetical protein
LNQIENQERENQRRQNVATPNRTPMSVEYPAISTKDVPVKPGGDTPPKNSTRYRPD